MNIKTLLNTIKQFGEIKHTKTNLINFLISRNVYFTKDACVQFSKDTSYYGIFFFNNPHIKHHYCT